MNEEIKTPGKKLSSKYYSVSRNHVSVSKQSTKHLNQLNIIAPMEGNDKVITQKD